MNPRTFTLRLQAMKAKFWLHDMTIAANTGFPAHEIGDIIRHLRQNRNLLLDAWNEHFGA
jgi:hypothetical protein